MTDRIQISPEVMRAVADHHDEVADKIADARQAGAAIDEAVTSYGPIMHRVKAAAADLLSQRDAALLAHDATHRSAADALRREAENFVSADEQDAERLRLD